MSRKRRSRQNSFDLTESSPNYLPDNFIPNIFPNHDTICVMCKQGHSYGLMMTNKMKYLKEIYEIDGNETTLEERYGLDPQGVWASLYPIDMSTTQSKLTWVHFVCAIFSPLTWLRANRWHNLKAEIRRCQLLECCVCKKRGATVGCFNQRCNYIIHVSCAISLGWSPTILRKRFTCPIHTAKVIAADQEADLQYMYDISKGQELIPVTMESSCSVLLTTVESSKLFKYITLNVDSDTTESNIVNTNNLPYCDCENNCSLQTKVPCQCSERSESIAQHLHLNPSFVMTECGMRCECTVGKCCRRTIGKGLTYHLHVFVYSKHHVVQKRRNYLLLDEEISDSDAIISEDDSHEKVIYGVRTKDSIVAGSFVCEIVGQYQKQDSDGSILPRDTEAYFPINQWINDCRNQDNTTSASAPISNATVDSINIHLDSSLYRNVGSFIRQSTDPTSVNLIRKVAYIDQINYAYPRLVVYAARDIASGEELLLSK